MADDRAAKAARAKALLKSRQKKKVGEPSSSAATTPPSAPASVISATSPRQSLDVSTVDDATGRTTPPLSNSRMSSPHPSTPSPPAPAITPSKVASPPKLEPNRTLSPPLDDLDSLRGFVETQQQTISLLVAEKASLAASLGELDGLAEKSQFTEKQLQEGRETVDALSVRVVQLQEESRESSRALEALTQAERRGKEQVSDLEREVEVHKRTISELRSQISQQGARMHELEQQLQADDRIEQLEKSLHGAQDRAETLESQLVKSKQAYNKAKTERDAFEEQVRQRTEAEQSLHQLLDALQAEHSQASDKLASLTSERNSFEASNGELRTKLDHLDGAFRDLEGNFQQAAAGYASTAKQLQIAQVEVTTVTKRASDLQTENEGLLSSLQELRPKVVELTGDKVNLGEKLDELAQVMRQRENVISLLESSLKETRAFGEAEMAKLRRSLEEAHKQYTARDREFDELVQAHKELRQENESSLVRVKELEAERAGLRRTIASHQEEIDQHSFSAEERKSESSDLARDRDEQRQAREELEEALQTSQSEVETLRGDLSRLTEELARLRNGSTWTPTTATDEARTPMNHTSLDEEMMNAIQQQHSLDLSAARAQIRALESAVHEEQGRAHALQRRVGELEAAERVVSPTTRFSPLPSPSLLRPPLPLLVPPPPPSRSSGFILRPTIEADLPPEQRHKRRVSLSMLKARINSELAPMPIAGDASPAGEHAAIVRRARSQFGDESHIFWCAHCRGDVLVL